MKKILITLLCVFSLSCNVIAQNFSESSLAKLAQQSPDAKVNFRLFPTTNRWTFLKLDTRSGIITHVQYSTKDDYSQMEYSLNSEPLVEESEQQPGRFFLYPTSNIYNFILLDQISGKCWQVQWNIDRSSRGIWRIY